MTERLPRPDGGKIRDTAIDVGEIVSFVAGDELLRVHPSGGAHPVAWNEFRAWGPTGSRFDHQARPVGRHATRRIAYLTYGPEAFTAALGEFFQDDNGTVMPFDLTRRSPRVVSLALAADLQLLQLASGWVTRAGGNQAIWSGARGTARDWARAIYRHHGDDVHGVAYPSSVWGPGRCVALWERAEPTMPDAPLLTRALADPTMLVPIAVAAEKLGTYF
ncbi:MAG: hypothetical protein H0V33_01760 [Acidimicrobiia bacterium]|nr:hypothetical protein [Acidimicrobiia bacterium]